MTFFLVVGQALLQFVTRHLGPQGLLMNEWHASKPTRPSLTSEASQAGELHADPAGCSGEAPQVHVGQRFVRGRNDSEHAAQKGQTP